MESEVKLRFNEGGDVLHVEAEGRVGLAAGVAMAREIAVFDGTAGDLPILLDVRRLEGQLSTLEMVRLVKTLIAEPLRYRRKLALLVRAGDQLQRAQFLEAYAENRSVPIAAFVEAQEAREWLTGAGAR